VLFTALYRAWSGGKVVKAKVCAVPDQLLA